MSGGVGNLKCRLFPGTVWCLLLFSSEKGKDFRSAMISVLAQERLLGAALGCIFTSVVVLEERKSIYSLISPNERPRVREPIFGKSTRSDCAHVWNKAVDSTLGPIIASLSSRGW